jgi:hypothetical protein
MLATPAVPPFTMPEEKPTEATEGLLLVHVPPVGVLERGNVAPEHTGVPEKSVGPATIVIDLVAIQPVGKV